jgi:GntR family transcriptional regulator
MRATKNKSGPPDRSLPRASAAADDSTGGLIRDGRSAGEIVEEQLRELIARGDYERHARLPPERELAGKLGVSRMTLRRALAALEEDGLVTRQAGRNGGTFLAQGQVVRNLSRYHGVPDYLRSQGFEAGCRVISASVESSDDQTARALGLPAGALVYRLVRVRLADGVPISIETARLPAEYFPGLLECPLGGSITELLANLYGRRLVKAFERLEAVLATEEQAALLPIRVGAPLMSIHRVTYDADGVVVELAHDLFRGDRTRTVVWTGDGD